MDDIDRRAREWASKFRAAEPPAALLEWRDRYEAEGREPIRAEADERLPDDVDDRDELVEAVADVVIEGLGRLP